MRHIWSHLAVLGALTAALVPSVVSASVYVPSHIGYDISFNTTSYPSDLFNFAIVGVTRGKAFVDNKRLFSEWSWSGVGSAGATIYMNLNAPYGSTVAGHVSSPKTCSALVVGTTSEPSVCAGYNYGYNAAAHSYAYAASVPATASFWWLDIEEANSWSRQVAVNDAVIQGAIDFLNMKGVRAGIYSTTLMWNDIAGKGFVPTQSIDGQPFTTPVWLPISVTTQVGAGNACITRKSFIPGSPIWLIQYLPTATSTDQNLAC